MNKKVIDRRRAIVSAVRRGASLRQVARTFNVALGTVQLWCRRAANQRLDRADFRDRPAGNPAPARASSKMEALVLSTRKALKKKSAHGEFGAASIHRELLSRHIAQLPCVRSIARIIERNGATDHKHRVRWPPPPRGWYLPDVANKQVELDSFDIVEGLSLQNGPVVDVLNGISLHGGLPASWSNPGITAVFTMEKLVQHWRQWGLPAFAQFDNDTRFAGPHHLPDVIGRVPRLCLSLGLSPVFAPPREPGFQNAIESFNGRWTEKVWNRFHFSSHHQLQRQEQLFIASLQQLSAVRREQAPCRRPFPRRWALDLQAPPSGCLIYLRRTDPRGAVTLLGHQFKVCKTWPHRLVRADVDLTAQLIRFYALRRREPNEQRLLRELKYTPKWRSKFH